MNAFGSESGFLENTTEVFIGQKDSKDYHREMNTKHFTEWLGKSVIPNVPKKSILVLDRATYHRAVCEETKNPTTSWRKSEIIKWLEEKGVELPDDVDTFGELKVPELRELASSNRVAPKIVVEELVRNCGKFFWLPVAHCELNPIELVWAAVKRKFSDFYYKTASISFNPILTGKVAEQNKTFKPAEVLSMTTAIMASQEINGLWKECVSHVVKVENILIENENIAEEFMQRQISPIIIPLGDSDTSDISGESGSALGSESEDKDDDGGNE